MNDRIQISQISMKDPLYQQERELRNKILLRPIGIPDYGWEKNDSRSWHFVAHENNRVLGCVVLVRLDRGTKRTQLIQMAVETELQGQGLGRKLVEELIAFAQEQEVKEIQIHARENVTRFYERLGFQIVGEPFEEVGVRHRHMLMLL